MARLTTAFVIPCIVYIVLGLSLSGAVNVGDENFSKDTSGVFYVFADKVCVQISILADTSSPHSHVYNSVHTANTLLQIFKFTLIQPTHPSSPLESNAWDLDCDPLVSFAWHANWCVSRMESNVSACAVQTIQIINPVNLTVVANISSDQYGLPLTNQAGGKNVSKIWNDAVYMQVGTSSTTLTCKEGISTSKAH